MIYTQEKLESMSDLMVNFTVAGLKGDLKPIPRWCEPLSCGDKMCYYDDFRNVCDRHADYCGEWKHCGDLIDECKIGHYPTLATDELFEAFSRLSDGFKNHSSVSVNAKRAVAIVYILIKQGVTK